MARTALTTQDLDADGLDLSLTAANADGHTLDGGGNVVLVVNNGSGADVDVTFQTSYSSGGLDLADRVVTVPAGDTIYCPRLAPRLFDRATGATDAGKVYVDFEAVTTVTVGALGV